VLFAELDMVLELHQPLQSIHPRLSVAAGLTLGHGG
jgi:hypothetical protein